MIKEVIDNLIGIFVPATAHAGMLSIPNYSKFHSWQGILAGVITYLIDFAGILAVVAIVYSGLKYITAGTDSTAAGAAKKNLVWAITGLIFVLLSLVIISEVNTRLR